MKKILIFSHEFPPDLGGAGVVALQNASELEKLGFSVDVVTRKSSSRSSMEDHTFNVFRINTLPKLWFLNYLRAIDHQKYDLILLNDPAAIYTAGISWPRSVLEKSVCFLHGTEPEEIYESASAWKKLVMFETFYTRCIKNCKRLVAPSKHMKEKFIRRVKPPISEDHISVSYAGVDSSIFYPQKNDLLREKYSIPVDATILLSASRIKREKGYGEKYEVFRNLVHSKGSNFYWMIVGDGDFLPELKSMVKMDELQDRVIFIGSVARTALPEYYSSCDVFWLLSRYDEAFGLVYIEAQMCGLPVIAREKGGCIEAVSDNVSGFLVSDLKQCEDLLLGAEWKRLQLEDVIRFAQGFSASETARRLVEVFK